MLALLHQYLILDTRFQIGTLLHARSKRNSLLSGASHRNIIHLYRPYDGTEARTNNIEHNCCTPRGTASCDCAGMGALPQRGPYECFCNLIWGWTTEAATRCTSWWPLIACRSTSTLCDASNRYRTRACPVLIGAQIGTRRRGVVYRYCDSESGSCKVQERNYVSYWIGNTTD